MARRSPNSMTAIKRLAYAAGPLLALIATTTLAAADAVRTGSSAYGDWRTDAPGVIRKITPVDLPAPMATTANRSTVIAEPDGAALKTMPGFTVTAFVTGMSGARVLRTAPNGDIFLARSRPDGMIMVIRIAAGDASPKVTTFATGLRDPYGIAFYPPGPDPKWIYVGEYGKVVRFPYDNGDTTASGEPETIVSDLATGGNHWTRDVAFSPDGRILYVAVGSASNVAEQMGPAPADLAAFQQRHAVGSAWDREEWRADVLAYDPDGQHRRVFAAGLRNCSGLAVQPSTGVVYCATNERDLLGDNLPPDYITSVKQGAFYGWPWYYIGDHPDSRAGGGPRADLAGRITIPEVLIQPHSAPLGITFNPGGNFPPGWTGDAFVALHGSWNRALRTGYKIIRVPFADGKPTGAYQDFVLGFVADDHDVWGRPVDVAFAHDGSMLFSDDGNGVVYRVVYKAK